MDSNTKVKRYLEDKQNDDASFVARAMKMQTAKGHVDPLHFVIPKANPLSEKAQETVQLTESQKRARQNELSNSSKKFADEIEEPWQVDLNQWKNKRRNRLSQGSARNSMIESEDTHVETDYHSLPNYGRRSMEETQHTEKSEVLTIRSPTSEDQHDSGIERNSHSHSPSTSIDFSPRSVDLISPKSGHSEQPTPESVVLERLRDNVTEYRPAPHLDQVVIPVSVPQKEEGPVIFQKHHQNGTATLVQDSVSNWQTSEIEAPNRARVTASLQEPIYAKREKETVQPFVAQAIRNTEPTKSVDVELTVELNREQKAQVHATRFPKTETRSTSSDSRQFSPRSPRQLIFDYQARLTGTSTDSYHQRSGSQESYRKSGVSAGVSPTNKYSPNAYNGFPGGLSASVSTPNLAQGHSSGKKSMLRTVDIPFDDSAAVYQPRRDKDGFISMTIEMGSQPVHKGFGFSVGKERRECVVQSVIVASPADRHGLLVGDRIHSMNGEKVEDQYPSAITRMLHEAARMGEVTLQIDRKIGRQMTSAVSMKDFAQHRNVFSEKTYDSYNDFKKKHSRASRDSAPPKSPRDYNSLPRGVGVHHGDRVGSFDSMPRRRRDHSANNVERRSLDQDRSENTFKASGVNDYRVSSLEEKRGPGRLTDFVPEVDRRYVEDRRDLRRSEEAPRTIRNYEISTETQTNVHANRPSTHDTAAATFTRSTLPRNGSTHIEEHASDDDTVPGKSFVDTHDWRHVINEQRQAAPGYTQDRERLKDVSQSLSNLPTYMSRRVEEQRKSEEKESRERRQYERSVYEGLSKPYSPVPPANGVSSHHNSSSLYYNRPYEPYTSRYASNTSAGEKTNFTTTEYNRSEYNKTETYSPVSAFNQTANYNQGAAQTSNYTQGAAQTANYNQGAAQTTNYNQGAAQTTNYNQGAAQSTNYNQGAAQHQSSFGQTSNYNNASAFNSSHFQTASQSANEQLGRQVLREPASSDNIVSISGKHRCAHCNEELGRGSAMIVESLNLYYHLACFNCYVCKMPLGGGDTGADVRVRDGRLHCQSCYSNDKLQLSKV